MNTVFNGYLVTGILVCGWFAMAAYSGWKMPSMASSSSSGSSFFYGGGSSYSRSSGGSWGGGK